MNQTTSLLLSSLELAQVLKLPEHWVKAEADAGRLPHLRIGKRYLFNLNAVVAVLAERAASGRGVESATA
jgi:excisionase family DNA binding protein